MINDFEDKVIFNVLEGGHEILSLLKNQVKKLLVIKRDINKTSYFVEFADVDKLYVQSLLSAKNIEVIDTRFYEENTEKVSYVKLTVLNGNIKYLQISNPDGFKNSPPVIDRFFWSSCFKEKYDSNEELIDAGMRDIRSAIGYLPSYK